MPDIDNPKSDHAAMVEVTRAPINDRQGRCEEPAEEGPLLALAERVEAESGADNDLDVLVEIAMFVPDEDFVAIRANDAGTKTICTTADGRERTFWARDYTISKANRISTAAALRARAQSGAAS